MTLTSAPAAPVDPLPRRAGTFRAIGRATPPPGLVYALVTLVGVGAFAWPFWVPSEALPAAAHGADAPLVAAIVGLLAVAVVALEVRRGTMTGATIAVLGVLAALGGLLRLFDLPGGGNAMFFLVVLAGAALGPRVGLLLGLCAMAVSAVLTGGVGPWLPFQMLCLAWMAAGAGVVGRATRRLPPIAEVAILALYAWAWGFLYGAVMNLWFWPFQVDGGALSYEPGLPPGELLARYHAFYVATSFAWDAAGAFANALLVALTGIPVLRSLRAVAHRLDPVTELTDDLAAPAA